MLCSSRTSILRREYPVDTTNPLIGGFGSESRLELNVTAACDYNWYLMIALIDLIRFEFSKWPKVSGQQSTNLTVSHCRNLHRDSTISWYRCPSQTGPPCL